METATPIRFANTGDITDMIRLDAGSFAMGTDSDQAWQNDGEGPVRQVTLQPYYIAAHTVTNAQFAQFIADTQYRTDSDKFGWSFVFRFHLFGLRNKQYCLL